METMELICIGCPLGCALTATIYGQTEEEISVSGNTCKNGEIYAKNEVLHPARMLTSSVPVQGGKETRVSVKTETAIPKDKMFECMSEIRKISASAPIKIGDTLMEDCAGTGVNIIATANVERI